MTRQKSEQFWEGVYRTLDPSKLASASSVFATEQPQAMLFLSLLPQGSAVLDYGCGTGRNAIVLLQQGMDVAVCDISETAMNLCVQRTRELGFSLQEVLVSARQPASQEALFDGILAWSVLDHMTLAEATEAAQVLTIVAKPGALLLASFDGPEEISDPVSHLSDGSMEIMAGKRAGMVLRVFSDEEVKHLFADWELISYSGGPEQRKVILCRRVSSARG